MSEKLRPAVCKCGHKGKSKRPEFYQCAYCYYRARATSNNDKARKLKHRAEQLEQEAQRFMRKAMAFEQRHDDVGSAWWPKNDERWKRS